MPAALNVAKETLLALRRQCQKYGVHTRDASISVIRQWFFCRDLTGPACA